MGNFSINARISDYKSNPAQQQDLLAKARDVAAKDNLVNIADERNAVNLASDLLNATQTDENHVTLVTQDGQAKVSKEDALELLKELKNNLKKDNNFVFEPSMLDGLGKTATLNFTPGSLEIYGTAAKYDKAYDALLNELKRFAQGPELTTQNIVDFLNSKAFDDKSTAVIQGENIAGNLKHSIQDHIVIQNINPPTHFALSSPQINDSLIGLIDLLARGQSATGSAINFLNERDRQNLEDQLNSTQDELNRVGVFQSQEQIQHLTRANRFYADLRSALTQIHETPPQDQNAVIIDLSKY